MSYRTVAYFVNWYEQPHYAWESFHTNVIV